MSNYYYSNSSLWDNDVSGAYRETEYDMESDGQQEVVEDHEEDQVWSSVSENEIEVFSEDDEENKGEEGKEDESSESSESNEDSSSRKKKRSPKMKKIKRQRQQIRTRVNDRWGKVKVPKIKKEKEEDKFSKKEIRSHIYMSKSNGLLICNLCGEGKMEIIDMKTHIVKTIWTRLNSPVTIATTILVKLGTWRLTKRSIV
jgi:hypothetical protein